MKCLTPKFALAICLLSAGCHTSAPQDRASESRLPETVIKPPSLVQIDSRDYGDTHCMYRIVELERNAKTSRLKLTYEKIGSACAGRMFTMRACYEIAKARGAEYLTNLKEWDDPEGGHIFIIGFTNTKDADIHTEFGDDFTVKNTYGQSRIFMSVSELDMFWGEEGK